MEEKALEPAEEMPSNDKELADHWHLELQLAKSAHEEFYSEGDEAYRVYFGKKAKDGLLENKAERKVNIFWSQVETLKPALFSRVPKMDVARREKGSDHLARVASQILEQATDYAAEECQDLVSVASQALQDYLVVGRGVLWERYEVEKESVLERLPVSQLEDGSFIYPDGAPLEEGAELQQDEAGFFVTAEYEKVVKEKSVTEYVNWKDYLHNTARNEQEVRWQAKRAYLTKEELIEQFGEIGAEVKRDVVPGELSKDRSREFEQKRYSKAEVWEIWDKNTQEVIWISSGLKGKLLKRQEDFLKLDGFFPCQVIRSNRKADSLIPRADYQFIKDQLLEIDRLTTRIHAHLEALRTNGCYDKGLGDEIEQVFEGDLNLVPLSNWPDFASKGGMQGVINFLPLETIANVLNQLYQSRESALQKVYEVTGISDIIRGATAPNETATAQQIKGNFANLRFSDRQRAVQRFLAAQLRVKAEIIAENFDAETIRLMSGGSFIGSEIREDQFSYVIELLRDDPVRRYRIDIETDSTVAIDENAEKQKRAEFLSSIGQFMGQALPMMQQYSTLAPLFLEFVSFAAKGYKAGRELEQKIEEGLSNFAQQQMQQAQQPQQADPSAMEAQQRMQIEQMRMQTEAAKQQHEMQLEGAKAQHEMQLEQMKAQLELAKIDNERQKLATEQMRLQLDAQMAGVELQAAEMKAAADIQRAERALQKEAMDTEQELIKAAAQTPQF